MVGSLKLKLKIGNSKRQFGLINALDSAALFLVSLFLSTASSSLVSRVWKSGSKDFVGDRSKAPRSSAKSARLRHAKEEAEREIAEYRAQMEADFQRMVAESSGDSGANVKRLEQETFSKIEQLKKQAAIISPEVIQMLLRHVTTVSN